ncbi:MAG: MFS transporter [Deltaproteobacteria bacterium]|nr:MFS transporter [Deltaproteobacteria bacterium]
MVGTADAPPKKTKRALLWISSTYFGEGLPWSFLHQMGTEYLTATGASKTQISATSWLHLAVTFKFVWSPVVDLFGRKRTWVVLTQFLLGLGMLAIALVVPRGGLTNFWLMMGALAIIHATHDIACDGFYLQALDKMRQALFSGVRMAAFRAAMIAGSSGLVVLAGQTNWFWGFGAAGVLMILVAGINAGVMPHPPEQPIVARAPGTDVTAGTAATAGTPAVPRAAFWVAYRSFFAQPQAVLVLSFMLFYKLGDIMMFAMSKPLMRDIGIDTSHRGVLNGIGTASFIVGSILGGATIARLGLVRCLIPMTFFQNLAIPLYIALAVLRPSFVGVVPIVIAEQFAAGIGAAAHVVFLMQRCRTAFSASHYALATAIVSLASTFSGAISGPLNESLGHTLFFTVAFIASWPSLVLVLFVPRAPLEPGT